MNDHDVLTDEQVYEYLMLSLRQAEYWKQLYELRMKQKQEKNDEN